jgi:hypothetical protein
MGEYLLKALDWSEVWALLIPLAVLLFRRQQPATLNPIIVYLCIGFTINLAIDIIMILNIYRQSTDLSNNALYNLHSVVRFICFSIYFIRLPQPAFMKFKKALGLASGLFLVINFSFFENFFNHNSLSGNLLATEAYLLLVYCMLYYLAELRDDNRNLFKGPDFWVVTGLSIYVVINFFVFLFYLPMIDVDVYLAVDIWNVHNIAYIIFCLFITKAFYGSANYKYSI